MGCAFGSCFGALPAAAPCCARRARPSPKLLRARCGHGAASFALQRRARPRTRLPLVPTLTIVSPQRAAAALLHCARRASRRSGSHAHRARMRRRRSRLGERGRRVNESGSRQNREPCGDRSGGWGRTHSSCCSPVTAALSAVPRGAVGQRGGR